MANHFMELAFTDSVLKVQEQNGTRPAYEKMQGKGEFRNRLTWQEKEFIKNRDSFYMATVGENGWPYMQYRGGLAGFLRVLDDNNLAFADFKGNGQFISAGNLNATNKAVLFLMDYVNQARLKVWVQAEVLPADEHPELLEKVKPGDYPADVERITVFKVEAFDWNCPQHITPRYTYKEMESEGLLKEPNAKVV